MMYNASLSQPFHFTQGGISGVLFMRSLQSKQYVYIQDKIKPKHTVHTIFFLYLFLKNELNVSTKHGSSELKHNITVHFISWP